MSCSLFNSHSSPCAGTICLSRSSRHTGKPQIKDSPRGLSRGLFLLPDVKATTGAWARVAHPLDGFNGSVRAAGDAVAVKVITSGLATCFERRKWARFLT
jgi:hypothetical protein